MNYRKQTAWKRSRKFGDVFGGRTAPKIPDKILHRAHPFTRPAPGEDTPIFIEDNPSRDFFFPVTRTEIMASLNRLPQSHVDGITHIWLRRPKKSEFEAGELPFAEFACGSSVRLIVLYPWPRNLVLHCGHSRPPARRLREYRRFGANLELQNGHWVLRWELKGLREFYIEHLLFHEVGHHVDKYLHKWTKANAASREEFADQYAVAWSARATRVHGTDGGKTRFFLND